MVTVVVFEFSVMRCQPLRRALGLLEGEMKIQNLELEFFLEQNNISADEWNSSDIEWQALKDIGIDHQSKVEQRKETAELFAKIIQRCSKVHSVRWRVKDPEHLMEKIVRKTINGANSFNSDYIGINKDNYHEIITDLVGIRALHLFKDDCLEIDSYLCGIWNTKERPTYYVRDGDETKDEFEQFEVKQHPAGYRSLHYVFESQPLNQIVYTEVQVRTIFEEGWSEIDHKIRYPNFSDNPQISYFLRIFNRLAGSADEMGSFVKELVNEFESTARDLDAVKKENEVFKKENDKNIAEIDRLFAELDSSNGKHESQTNLVKDLKAQVEKLKSQTKNSADNQSLIRNSSGAGKVMTSSQFLKYLAQHQSDAELEQKPKRPIVKPKSVKKT
ncbi:RelA/SpoT domain-containing protein [Vibrio cholerae]|uniref:RelA/SpoT domain-containing protein n=1 Tax=Vibrio cholerae TaxID=666 RepID=UPI00308108CD